MKDTNNITLSDELKRARLSKNLTMKEVAKATGYTYPYIWQLENNNISALPRTIWKLCDLLGLDREKMVALAELNVSARKQYLYGPTSKKVTIKEIVKTKNIEDELWAY